MTLAPSVTEVPQTWQLPSPVGIAVRPVIVVVSFEVDIESAGTMSFPFVRRVIVSLPLQEYPAVLVSHQFGRQRRVRRQRLGAERQRVERAALGRALLDD